MGEVFTIAMISQDHDPQRVARHAATILDYWFSTLDNTVQLDQKVEPFRTCFQRWYGKDPSIDAEIRKRFELLLFEVTTNGGRLDEIIAAWAQASRGLLALVVLLDQLPRNMYRDTPRMYAHDALALAVTLSSLRELEHEPLPLVWRMFLYVPLMHAEDLTIQEYMLARFDDLTERARTQSPHNVAFFELALDYARRHVDVIARFGRFPHRNAILSRQSSPGEEAYLREHPGF